MIPRGGPRTYDAEILAVCSSIVDGTHDSDEAAPPAGTVLLGTAALAENIRSGSPFLCQRTIRRSR
jgi:hypothetical protein